MKARELMIGNWVTHYDAWSYRMPDEGPFIEFDFQWQSIDWYAIGESCLELDKIKPIPLTEEWLLKFGFYKLWHLSAYEYTLRIDEANLDIEVRQGFQGNINRFRVNLSVDGEQYAEAPQSINDAWLTHIQYVHQLQNLYFSLTGTELEIKN